MVTLLIRTASSRALMRWCALAIAVLAIVPFTPPFSTFDLRALGADRAMSKGVPTNERPRGPSINDAVFFLESCGEDKLHPRHLIPAAARQLPVAVNAGPERSLTPWLRPLVHDRLGLVASPILRI